MQNNFTVGKKQNFQPLEDADTEFLIGYQSEENADDYWEHFHSCIEGIENGRLQRSQNTTLTSNDSRVS